MKNAAFYNVTPCGSCNNRRFGGTYHLHDQHADSVALVMDAILSSETTVLTTATRHYFPEGGILQSPPLKPQIIHTINQLGSVAEK
jgi:hypothetical protein